MGADSEQEKKEIVDRATDHFMSTIQFSASFDMESTIRELLQDVVKLSFQAGVESVKEKIVDCGHETLLPGKYCQDCGAAFVCCNPCSDSGEGSVYHMPPACRASLSLQGRPDET